MKTSARSAPRKSLGSSTTGGFIIKLSFFIDPAFEGIERVYLGLYYIAYEIQHLGFIFIEIGLRGRDLQEFDK